MTPSALLECLHSEGFSVRALSAQGGCEERLLIDPIAKLTAERVGQITACRTELIALLLTGREPDAEWEAKTNAIALEAHCNDPFTDGPVALCEYDLIKVSSDGEPPVYVATRSNCP